MRFMAFLTIFIHTIAYCQLNFCPLQKNPIIDSLLSKDVIFVISEFNFIQLENKHDGQPLFILITNGDYLGRRIGRYRLIGDSSFLNNGKISEDFIKRE